MVILFSSLKVPIMNLLVKYYLNYPNVLDRRKYAYIPATFY
nr:MAG TPA: hypothetical protein [Caudoviricetes sp.]